MSTDDPSAVTRPGSGLMGGRRRLLASAAVALTAVAGVTAAHAASAAVSRPTLEQPDPAATSFDPDFWRRQEQLADLRAWIEALPAIKASGYITNINNRPVDGSTADTALVQALTAKTGVAVKIEHDEIVPA